MLTALVWVAYYYGLTKAQYGVELQEQPSGVVSVLIGGKVKAQFKSPAKGQVAMLSANPKDQLPPGESLKLLAASDKTILCELPLFKQTISKAESARTGQIVLHRCRAVAFLVLRVLSAYPHPQRPSPFHGRPTDSLWAKSLDHKAQAAVLFESVAMCCWRGAALKSLTEAEQETLWDEIFSFNSLPSKKEECINYISQKYREAQSCSSYFKRDVAKLLRSTKVEITRPRAFRCILELLSPFLGSKFFTRFCQECPPEVREQVLCATMLTDSERRGVLNTFVAQLEAQYPVQMETKIWWKIQCTKDPEHLADLLVGNTLATQIPKHRLVRWVVADPERVIKTLLAWDGRMTEQHWNEFEELSLLCEWLGPEGKLLKSKLEDRLIRLPHTDSSPSQQELVSSQLFRTFQKWRANEPKAAGPQAPPCSHAQTKGMALLTMRLSLQPQYRIKKTPSVNGTFGEHGN